MIQPEYGLFSNMFEGHPNLLPGWFDGDPGAAALNGEYVRRYSQIVSRQA